MTRSVVQWDGTAAPMTDKSEFEALIEGAAWAQRPPTPGLGRAGTSLPRPGNPRETTPCDLTGDHDLRFGVALFRTRLTVGGVRARTQTHRLRSCYSSLFFIKTKVFLGRAAEKRPPASQSPFSMN